MTVPSGLDRAGRAAVRRILEHPKFEVLPLKNVLDQVRWLPDGATVSITASPTKTLEDTMDVATELRLRGFQVVPHLSARMTHDKRHLAALLGRMEQLEMSRIFLVGGDAPQRGIFPDAYSLLLAMDDLGHHLTEIGVTSYPEGHAVIPDDKLRQALHDKQPFASYLTTQMCFDAEAIGDFVSGCRADGITLPVRIGIPGVADRLKLIQISTRIGVGQSVRFLSKHRGLVTKFIKPGGYAPEDLLEGLAPLADDPAAAIVGVHIYTFNQCETTERWRQEYLATL
ncbi:MAG: 5,10-methylenetetrahydrofolate reductase [Acidimicrobiia bacterium]|nr:5,10-methylenetetrahydrofolate reductase [Acidimicrobiia bacterium]